MRLLALQTCSCEETGELGRKLGALLQPGAFLALQGELGGGKTCFTRGLVESVAPESAHLVASPTFAIMNEYPGRIPVYHFDFYRLTSAGEIIELGFEDYFHSNGICVVEWSERLGELLPPKHLRIAFSHAGDDRRNITFDSCDPESIELIETIALIFSALKRH